VLATVPVDAQSTSAETGPYVIAAGLFAYATQGAEESPYAFGLIGGPTFAVQMAGGIAQGFAGVEGEVSVHGQHTAAQRNRTQRFTTHHRDVLVSGLVRFLRMGTDTVAIVPVAGLTYGTGRRRFTDAFSTGFFGRPEEPIVLEPQRLHSVGMTGGVDLFGRRSRPVEVGLTTRFSWLSGRMHNPDGPQSGIGGAILRVGAAVKFGG
jgi:hypothetical protein